MAATFELWEVVSGNIVGAYASEAEALTVVADTVRTGGPSAAESFLLIREDRRGRSRVIAQGAELAKRALTAAGEPRPLPT